MITDSPNKDYKITARAELVKKMEEQEGQKFYFEEFGDGITIEIHSYCTGDVWEQLKNSRVQTGKPCNVDGQISTALQPTVEGVNPRPIYVEKSN